MNTTQFNITLKYKKKRGENMGEIKDILDSIKDLRSGIASAGVFTTKRSIASRALDGTAEFPVVIDDSIPLEDAVVIGNALERKFASFLLTVLTMNPYLEIKDGQLPSASDYVKAFHQNMRIGNPANIGVDFAKLEDAFESTIAKYNLDYTAVEEAAVIVAYQIFENVHSAVADRFHQATNYTIGAVTNPISLNDIGGRIVLEVDGSTRGKGPRGTTGDQSSGNTATDNTPDDTSTGEPTSDEAPSTKSNEFITRRTKHKFKFKPKFNASPNYTIKNIIPGSANTKPRFTNNLASGMDYSVNAKFEKANATIPTMLHVRIYPIDPESKEQVHEAVDFVLGVKAMLHPVPADVMVETLASGINGSNAFLDFIKWTTGETKFFRDFVFAVNQQKADAISYNNPAKQWLIASKRRGTWAKVQNKFSKNALYPIMTVVISKETSDALAELHGYNIERNPAFISSLMKTYYLLGFVRVNTATQRVDIYMDCADGVETVTLSTLSKEGTMDDRKFKDMMRMIGRSV